MNDRDVLIQIVMTWAEDYEKGNPEVCEILLGEYKNELGNKLIF